MAGHAWWPLTQSVSTPQTDPVICDLLVERVERGEERMRGRWRSADNLAEALEESADCIAYLCFSYARRREDLAQATSDPAAPHRDPVIASIRSALAAQLDAANALAEAIRINSTQEVSHA